MCDKVCVWERREKIEGREEMYGLAISLGMSDHGLSLSLSVCVCERERERERYLKEVVDHIKFDDRLATDIVIDYRDIHILQCIAADSKNEAPHYIIICPQRQRLLIAEREGEEIR